MEDQSGTINPAALNTASSTIAPNLLTQPSPARGTKRSRSPDSNGIHGIKREADDVPSNKRSKSIRSTESPAATAHKSRHAVQTPTIKSKKLPETSPMQTSPPRSTPGSANKPVKALPTVRDHTTDQLAPEGDEYVPREIDPDGELKVSKDGEPLEGRKFRCRTFNVPNRGDKLFMLATECARVLGYRDSYLLFNKNRSLFKIIANQAEKDSLIHQEVLPYSYRSRQIAIVTARSMFRQFGSRLVENGKRVRDDYWVAKAIKQGFTEADAAGEKRPGAGKAREQAAAEQASATRTTLPQGQIIYSHDPDMSNAPAVQDQSQLAPLPMIHLSSDEIRPSNYATAIRPRQEINAPPFQDRTQPSSVPDIMTQASQAAEYNRQLSQTRTHRSNYLGDYWRKPHEQPIIETPDMPAGPGAQQQQPTMQSPQAVSHMTPAGMRQDSMSHMGAQVLPQPYPGYPNQQNPMASPVQQMHRGLPGPGGQGSPTMGGMSATPGSGTHRPNPGSYGAYAQQATNTHQMWQQQQQQQQQGTPQQQQQQQPHPSPIQQSHHPAAAMQYGQQQQMLPPQMAAAAAQQASMTAYQQQMNAAMNNPAAAAYGQMSRGMYQQGGAGTPQQHHQQHQQQPSTPQHQQQQQQHYGQQQGWAGAGPQDWSRY